MKELVVDRQRLRHNLSLTKERARGQVIFGVLKGDAYGLGLLEVARVMRNEGISRFAVGEPWEGALLRKEGFVDEEILLLRSTADPVEIEAILDAGLTACVGSRDAALALSGLAERRSTIAEAHLKIDTGCGRYGFLPSEWDKIKSVLQYMGNIAFTGVYTQVNAHAGQKNADEQMARFRTVIGHMQKAGVETGLIHAAGSTALFRYELPRLGAVRAGLSVSGRIPHCHGLLPVGYIQSAVVDVRWLPKGAPIAGGRALRRRTRMGLVPVGVEDGFFVQQIKKQDIKALFRPRVARVSVGTIHPRVLGQVGMNHTVIDITDEDCGLGDTAVLEVNPVFARTLPKRYI